MVVKTLRVGESTIVGKISGMSIEIWETPNFQGEIKAHERDWRRRVLGHSSWEVYSSFIRNIEIVAL